MNAKARKQLAEELASLRVYVRGLKRRSRLTQEKFSNLVGVNRATLNRWLAGEVLPSMQNRKLLKMIEEELNRRESPEDYDRLGPLDARTLREIAAANAEDEAASEPIEKALTDDAESPEAFPSSEAVGEESNADARR